MAPVLVNPWIVIAGLAVIALLRPRSFLLFAIAGIVLSLRLAARDAEERKIFAAIDEERFVTIEAPIDRDWSVRDSAFVLRTESFRADGKQFHAPLAVYARFEPPPIGMEATLRAEGFLRLSERGRYTVSVKSAELLSYEGHLPRWHPKAWNRALANRLRRHAAAYPNEVALAQALVLGRGEMLSDEMRESFRRGGTYHLLVFSGLQIAFAAGLLAALLRWLHAPRASDWLLLVFAGLAPLFIGPTASVARASIGIGVYALSRILHRPTSLENLWCLAALLRLLLEPGDLTDASFHLTYAGAGALLFNGKHFHRLVGSLAAAEIAIAPLTLFHFHQYTLGGSLITLAMSPLIFAMLILSSLACAFPWFLEPLGALHRACGFLNGFGLSGFYAAPPVASWICAAFAALLGLALLRGKARAIAIACVLLVPAAAAIVRSRSQRSVEYPQVTFFDVGQGDAAALRSGEKTMVVDGGRDGRLLPLLADRGIRRIDEVVLTHAHPDHCGALPQLVEQFDVGRLWITPRKFTGDCAERLLAACSRSAHADPLHPRRHDVLPRRTCPDRASRRHHLPPRPGEQCLGGPARRDRRAQIPPHRRHRKGGRARPGRPRPPRRRPQSRPPRKPRIDLRGHARLHRPPHRRHLLRPPQPLRPPPPLRPRTPRRTPHPHLAHRPRRHGHDRSQGREVIGESPVRGGELYSCTAT